MIAMFRVLDGTMDMLLINVMLLAHRVSLSQIG